ncbi:hypothetical protein LR48_Vigan11g060700 [Vigna angularis]|uniref:Uncharacterized protein n=1 Tax=Phaseolus angularis TaxID=3914 RepID=A0A0L9VS57_PHAAN|nr:hypothetical protein LR48_Vigan11g060700 [Vigna angularis]
MASDGCDLPIPPLAKSDKEKGKKKSYMVKLLNRFHNVNASSSQPSTPTSTSTTRFVPPPLQVPGLTPTRDNPLHSSSAANDFEDVSNNRPIITPIGGGSAANDFEDVSNNRPIITPIGGGQKCETAKKNKTSDKGGCLHTRGSISVHEHAIRLELGRSVHVDEIFQQTHIRASTGEFVDERSRWTHEEFEAKFSQIRSETASVGASACAPLDPADEERLRNQCWLDVSGGRYKGRVYGIGNVNLMKEVKKDRDGIRKELKKCKRRKFVSTAQRRFTAERHSGTHVGSVEG